MRVKARVSTEPQRTRGFARAATALACARLATIVACTRVATAVACAVLLWHPVDAHATLVIGKLSVTPDPPVAGQPLRIDLALEDTLLTPVEKARVRVELRAFDPGGAAVPESVVGTEASDFLATLPAGSSGQFAEGATEGGYVGTLTAPAAGTYTLSVRDTTFLNEEAIANVPFEVGGAANGAIPFVLPPTPVAPRSLSTWLIWLVGIPLLVGAGVTVLVLRRAPQESEAK